MFHEKFKKNRTPHLLVFFALILFSCSSGKEKFTIEEVETASDGTLSSKYKFEVTKFGSHYFYSSGSNNDLLDVTISFDNKQLSDILDKLEYPYGTKKLEKNPFLNIDYYKENTTKEKAVKNIVSQLKKTYDL